MAVEESKNIPENIPIEIDDIQCEEDNFQDKVSSIIYPDIRRKKKRYSCIYEIILLAYIKNLP